MLKLFYSTACSMLAILTLITLSVTGLQAHEQGSKSS